MNESELYKELGILTKDRDMWKENIPYVSSLLNHKSEKIQAKALWLLGEMGLVYPLSVQNAVHVIAHFCDSPVPLFRERAVNALGRIGRGSFQVIEPYWENLFRFAADDEPQVRLSFIWASENIATNSPDLYEHYINDLRSRGSPALLFQFPSLQFHYTDAYRAWGFQCWYPLSGKHSEKRP